MFCKVRLVIIANLMYSRAIALLIQPSDSGFIGNSDTTHVLYMVYNKNK